MVGGFLCCVYRDEELAPRDDSLMAEERFTARPRSRCFSSERGRRGREGMI
jgi:hypothetical protein